MRKGKPWLSPLRSTPGETMVFGVLGIVAMAAIILAVVWASPTPLETKAPAPARQDLPVVSKLVSPEQKSSL